MHLRLQENIKHKMKNTALKIFLILFVACALLNLASADCGNLNFNFKIEGAIQNYVISSIPGVGTVLQITQILEAIAGGPTAWAHIAGNIAFSQLESQGLEKLFGEQVGGSLQQVKDFCDISIKDTIIKEMKIDRSTGIITKGLVDVKDSEGKTNSFEFQNVVENVDKEKGLTTYTIKKDGFLKVTSGNEVYEFKNIEEGGTLTFKEGDLERADFTSKGDAKYVLAGQPYNIPPNTRTHIVLSNGNVILSGSGSFEFGTNKDKIDFQGAKNGMVAISGTTIVSDKAFKINDVEISNYYDAKKNRWTKCGVSINEEGLFVLEGSATKKYTKINVYGENNPVLIAKSKSPENNQNYDAWIYIGDEEIKAKTEYEGKNPGVVNFEILEGNKLINVKKGGVFKGAVTNGNEFSIVKEGDKSVLNHKTSGWGISVIQNGKTKVYFGTMLTKREKAICSVMPGAENLKSVELELNNEYKRAGQGASEKGEKIVFDEDNNTKMSVGNKEITEYRDETEKLPETKPVKSSSNVQNLNVYKWDVSKEETKFKETMISEVSRHYKVSEIPSELRERIKGNPNVVDVKVLERDGEKQILVIAKGQPGGNIRVSRDLAEAECFRAVLNLANKESIHVYGGIQIGMSTKEVQDFTGKTGSIVIQGMLFPYSPEELLKQ